MILIHKYNTLQCQCRTVEQAGSSKTSSFDSVSVTCILVQCACLEDAYWQFNTVCRSSIQGLGSGNHLMVRLFWGIRSTLAKADLNTTEDSYIWKKPRTNYSQMVLLWFV